MTGAVIVGAGPGIGAAVARRFASAGLPMGLIARSAASIDATRAALTGTAAQVVSATADVAHEGQLAAALDAVTGRLGVPDVLVYNAGLIQRDRPGELGYQRHLSAYAVNVLGALAAAARLAPAMAAAGGGSILITGGMPVPDPAFTSLSLGKAGVRALTSLLASEYGPMGVHVATVTVAGAVAAGGAFDPARIAEHYWRLHSQPRHAWQQEAVVTGEPVTGPGTSTSTAGTRDKETGS